MLPIMMTLTMKQVAICLSLIAVGCLSSSALAIQLEESDFKQNIIHPVVTAESEIDLKNPFVPHHVISDLPPRAINLECRCGIHDHTNQVRSLNDIALEKSETLTESSTDSSVERVTIQETEKTTSTADLDSYVVGNGSETGINEFPWIVALIDRKPDGTGEHFCGGVLIGSRLVLTATHCLVGHKAEKTEIWLNDRDLLLSTETPNPTLKIQAKRLIPHPKYHPLMLYNDISLIELSENVDVTMSHLRPICLPPSANYDATKEGKKEGTTAGWGQTSFTGPKSDRLLHVNVPLIPNQKCREESEAWYRDRVTDHMICAGDLERGGPDSCPGDSGGPLFVELEDKQYQLIGIVSWGDRCAEPRKPGVYTNVAKYIKWIDSVEKEVKHGNFRCAT